jgi:hypothetical protein
MTALPGEGGITAAWKMEVATVDGMASALERDALSEFSRLAGVSNVITK